MKGLENSNGSRKKLFTKKVLFIIIAAILVIGTGAGIGLVKASDSPAFCTACHIMQPYYQSWQSSDLLANKHAAAGVTCHQCHESSISIQAEEGLKFVTGDYKTPLDKREFGTREFCLKCHSDSGGATTFEEAQTKTNFGESNPHDSHNGEQDCNLCHNMHQQSQVMCAECHTFNWMKNLDGSWKQQ
jgi:Nitrate/TMAO reductases, membrane-bound tetraheme cytochrome c subunit